MHTIWPAVQRCYASQGRGALVVDLTIHLGASNPFLYFSKEEIEQHADPDDLRLVNQYNPQSEFVIILLKESTNVTYCVQNHLAQS